ncbi:MAG: class I SAM-dependent methyltransferase [Cytophagales bacterium]|nr:class I SAM-dependent methyltransferase [Cytophagales bacterium]MDW8384017.1 class I SAM-dependent methyltransferase [Flammeovirgaceae bacterium]
MTYSLLSPTEWQDYELIDCGNFEKLERFGPYVLIRPEPQAIWQRKLSYSVWQQKANARFVRGNSPEEGWTVYNMPHHWKIRYQIPKFGFTMKLSFTSFGHIGIFPEQAENWKYIFEQVRRIGEGARVLNLFAYTGGATLAAKTAGASVVHVDAVKQVVNWAKENAALNNTEQCSWLVEDALKFIRREAKRGHQYQGIILDPPAYGRGPNGEKWILEENLDELINFCHQILAPQQSFFVLNMYSMGLSALVAENLVKSYFGNIPTEIGECFLSSTTGFRLPLGTFLRFQL